MVPLERPQRTRLAMHWAMAAFWGGLIAAVAAILISFSILEKDNSRLIIALFSVIGAALSAWLQCQILARVFPQFSAKNYFLLVFSAHAIAAAIGPYAGFFDIRTEFGAYLLYQLISTIAIFGTPVVERIAFRTYLPKSVSWIWMTYAIEMILGSALMSLIFLTGTRDPIVVYRIATAVSLPLTLLIGFVKGLWLNRLIMANDFIVGAENQRIVAT